MSALILELKQGESMILNGAVIRFKTRTRLELNTQARFLFGKQIMQAEEAVTMPRKIYFALQNAYIGAEEVRTEALFEARALIETQRRDQPAAADLLDQLLGTITHAAGFEALKLARKLIRDETG
jgi:flagellar protein FlbT